MTFGGTLQLFISWPALYNPTKVMLLTLLSMYKAKYKYIT